MKHRVLFDGMINLGGDPVTTELTAANGGISVSGNTITVTPTSTPRAGTVSAAYLTFANGNGDTVTVNANIFN